MGTPPPSDFFTYLRIPGPPFHKELRLIASSIQSVYRLRLIATLYETGPWWLIICQTLPLESDHRVKFIPQRVKSLHSIYGVNYSLFLESTLYGFLGYSTCCTHQRSDSELIAYWSWLYYWAVGNDEAFAYLSSIPPPPPPWGAVWPPWHCLSGSSSLTISRNNSFPCVTTAKSHQSQPYIAE